MKKVYYIIALLATSIFHNASGQADSTGKAIGVYNSEGREVVTITQSGTDENGLSLTFDGIRIDFFGSATQLIEPGRKQKRYYKGHNGFFQLGWNSFTPPGYSAYPDAEHGFLSLQNGKSLQVAFNIFNMSTALNKSKTLGFSAGIGLKWNNFVFDEPLTLGRRERMVYPVYLDRHIKKSKLTTFAFSIPVQLEVNFNKFFIAGGLYADLTTGSHTKVKSPVERVRRKQYVNFFQGGVHGKIGYKKFYVYGTYGLSKFFQDGKGPGTQPYTIGFGF